MSSTKQLTPLDIVNRAIEPFGPYQILLTFILCFYNSLGAISHTVGFFHNFMPESYSCTTSNTTTISAKEKCVPGCYNYSFEGNDVSLVTEWSLVCDRRYLSALINTIYFIGVMLGCTFWGILADKFGRKIEILVCLYLQGIFGASLYFAQSLEVFIVLRLFQGVFIQGLFNSSLVLLQELTPIRHLTMTGLVHQGFWSIGICFLGIAAYFVRNWRQLQLILAIPTLLTLSWSWLIVESLTWSIENGKAKQALKDAMKIAERNKDKEFIKEYKEMNSLLFEIPKEVERENTVVGMNLLRNSILFKHFGISILMAFGINISYFTVILNAPSLPLGPHVSFIIGALSEFVSNVIVLFFIEKFRIGRRSFTIVSTYVVGVLCLIHGFGMYFGAKENIVFAILARIEQGVNIAMYSVVLIYIVELFPTVLRTTALGFTGLAGEIGSTLAPQLGLLGELVNPIVPMAVLGFLLVLIGSSNFFTPETRDKQLPNSIEDVQKIWGKKK